jgi:alkylhydroperoxidase family enzyme
VTDDTRRTAAQFLDHAEVTSAAQAEFDADLAELGFVMNAVRLWAYQPEAYRNLLALIDQVAAVPPFTFRQRGILVTACASTLGDSYCSLAWGTKLAGRFGPELPAGVLRGDDQELSRSERALAAWARQVTRNPNGTTADDIRALREAGFGDAHIFAMTVYVALRIALATVNDALGARPDAAFLTGAPTAVLASVTYGRPIDGASNGERLPAIPASGLCGPDTGGGGAVS